ncbi:MAG TPA: 1-acyl-sn-glycerol-3-phosphate acyltransferase [Planctomycetes bacterium]|nr:1-acyl-sn-glycerol-3-phosphate acyltransferase [Planctomycetota bacterium]
MAKPAGRSALQQHASCSQVGRPGEQLHPQSLPSHAAERVPELGMGQAGEELSQLPTSARTLDFGRLARPSSRLDSAVFWVFHTVVRLFFRICFRFRIEGAPPKSGGYVLVANHTSFLDPLLLGASLRRRVVYLMTETVWRSKSTGWFYRWNRSITLSARGGNVTPCAWHGMFSSRSALSGSFRKGASAATAS